MHRVLVSAAALTVSRKLVLKAGSRVESEGVMNNVRVLATLWLTPFIEFVRQVSAETESHF